MYKCVSYTVLRQTNEITNIEGILEIKLTNDLNTSACLEKSQKHELLTNDITTYAARANCSLCSGILKSCEYM